MKNFFTIGLVALNIMTQTNRQSFLIIACCTLSLLVSYAAGGTANDASC